MKINASNVLLVETRPTRDGNGVFLHLREVEGRPATITSDDLTTQLEVRSADEVKRPGRGCFSKASNR